MTGARKGLAAYLEVEKHRWLRSQSRLVQASAVGDHPTKLDQSPAPKPGDSGVEVLSPVSAVMKVNKRWLKSSQSPSACHRTSTFCCVSR